MSTMEPLAQGRQALEAGAWEQARASFEQALGQEETAEALKGLAVSARWLGDASRAIDAGERAFLLHRRRGDDEAAARVAALLSLEVLESRGDTAVASGWLARAQDLLRDRPLSPWNAMVDGIEGGLAGMYEQDLPRASRLLERAATGPARPATWMGSCWPAPSSASSWSAPARSPTRCACSTAPPQEPPAARSPTPPARSPSAACSPWPAWPSGTWNGRRNGRAMPWTRRPAGAAGRYSTTRAPTGRRC